MKWIRATLKRLFTMHVNIDNSKLMKGNKQIGTIINGIAIFYKTPGPNWIMKAFKIKERPIIMTYCRVVEPNKGSLILGR